MFTMLLLRMSIRQYFVLKDRLPHPNCLSLASRAILQSILLATRVKVIIYKNVTNIKILFW